MLPVFLLIIPYDKWWGRLKCVAFPQDILRCITEMYVYRWLDQNYQILIWNRKVSIAKYFHSGYTCTNPVVNQGWVAASDSNHSPGWYDKMEHKSPDSFSLWMILGGYDTQLHYPSLYLNHPLMEVIHVIFRPIMVHWCNIGFWITCICLWIYVSIHIVCIIIQVFHPLLSQYSTCRWIYSDIHIKIHINTHIDAHYLIHTLIYTEHLHINIHINTHIKIHINIHIIMHINIHINTHINTRSN